MRQEPNPFDGERIARGRYRFGRDWKVINLVQYPFDYHLEMLDPEARAGLPAHRPNADGYLFYLVPDETEPLESPFHSAGAAKAWADGQPWGPVDWEQT